MSLTQDEVGYYDPDEPSNIHQQYCFSKNTKKSEQITVVRSTGEKINERKIKKVNRIYSLYV